MIGSNKKSDKRFIALYRLKLQRELDAMGYPGGKLEETAVEGLVVDAGGSVRLRSQDRGSKKRGVAPVR